LGIGSEIGFIFLKIFQKFLFLKRESHDFYPWVKREKTNLPKAKPEDITGFARDSL